MSLAESSASLPRRLVRALRAAKRAVWAELWPKKNWRGIYRSFSEVGEPSKAFNVAAWAASCRELVIATRAQTAGTIPAAVKGDELVLPLVAATLAADDNPIRIVDFGGAAGVSYAMVRAALSPQAVIDYTVVELPPIVEVGQQLFASDPSVHFVSQIPASAGPVDIVVISTALQYIEDWQAPLRELANLRPRFFLLARLSAGDIPTFITAQINHGDNPTPYRFLNIDELKQAMNELGYRSILSGASLTRADESDLPASHRLATACTLLFARKEERAQ